MKVVPQISAKEAAQKVKNNDTILCGGFGMTGAPVHLLHALAETDTKNLTYIGNNVGEPGLGGDRLLTNGQLKKMIGSYFTSNPNAVKWAQDGKVEYDLLPQGTLGEAIRAGGMGIGGFFTPTSAGTVLADKMDTKIINGIEQVFVEGIRGNVAFVRAWKADTAGNLCYRMTEQNFNPAMATACDLVIAEVEEIVPVGELDPNKIHTQACFVDFLVEAKLQKEHLGSSASVGSKKAGEDRMNIARRALKELQKGDIVNLGIGIPTLVADLIKEEDGIILHLANWAVPGKPLLGVGGAMDLASGSKKLIITMNHNNKDGSPKLVKECALPITAMNAVDIVITDKAVFSISESGFALVELMSGVTLEEVKKSTGVEFANKLN